MPGRCSFVIAIRERIGHGVRQYREPSLRPELPNDDGLLEVEQGCKPACFASRVGDERRVGEDRPLRDRERQRPAVAIEQRPPGGRQLDGAEALAVAVRDIATGVQDLDVGEPDDDRARTRRRAGRRTRGAGARCDDEAGCRRASAASAGWAGEPDDGSGPGSVHDAAAGAGAGRPRAMSIRRSPRDRRTDRGDLRGRRGPLARAVACLARRFPSRAGAASRPGRCARPGFGEDDRRRGRVGAVTERGPNRCGRRPAQLPAGGPFRAGRASKAGPGRMPVWTASP